MLRLLKHTDVQAVYKFVTRVTSIACVVQDEASTHNGGSLTSTVASLKSRRDFPVEDLTTTRVVERTTGVRKLQVPVVRVLAAKDLQTKNNIRHGAVPEMRARSPNSVLS